VNFKTPSFHRRMQQRRSSAIASPNKPRATPHSLLLIIGQMAQLALAIVAIFGYFYTVRPVYQKDRLAEQVAEYEGIIKVQKPKILAFEKQLDILSGQRDRFSAELTSIEKRLSVARAEKEKIERQIQFMTFRYHLPDGRPATTHEQVQAALDFALATKVAFEMSSHCSSESSEGETEFQRFPFSFDYDDIKKSEAFPFTRHELKVWTEHGVRYPLTKTLSCATQYADSLITKYSNDPRSSHLIATFKEKALREIKEAGSKPWIPPSEPVEIIKELVSKQTAMKLELAKQYRKIEEEYGDRESNWGEAQQANEKRNYEVSRLNARIKSNLLQSSLESKYEKEADAFCESIHEEITRLVNTVRKDTFLKQLFPKENFKRTSTP
jgi:hypothetical protein